MMRRAKDSAVFTTPCIIPTGKPSSLPFTPFCTKTLELHVKMQLMYTQKKTDNNCTFCVTENNFQKTDPCLPRVCLMSQTSSSSPTEVANKFSSTSANLIFLAIVLNHQVLYGKFYKTC